MMTSPPDRPGRADRPPLRAVFLDRDGTLIEHVPYLRDPADVALLPGVREALAAALAAGMKLFLFTNQSGVGRGYFTLADVERVNRRMLELLGLGHDLFAGTCIATERPDEPQRYRKPSPRFIHESLAAHGIHAGAAWMVGDSPVDWEAGVNAGVRVAAVGPAAFAEEMRARRGELGVPAYAGIAEWWREVVG